MIDWVNNQAKTSEIERQIFMLLNTKYFKKIKMADRKKLVQPLLQLAKNTLPIWNEGIYAVIHTVRNKDNRI